MTTRVFIPSPAFRLGQFCGWIFSLIVGISAYAANNPPPISTDEAAAKPAAARPALRGARALGPFSVFDTDHDGLISAEEISAAAEVLRSLDKNHDGVITAAELRPDRPPPPPPGRFGERLPAGGDEALPGRE
jgi:hypothetical protein